MNVLDIALVLVLIMSAIVGFRRGAIKEIVSFVGIIIVFIVAFLSKEYLEMFFVNGYRFYFAGN